MRQYAQVPTPIVLRDRIRLLFGCRPFDIGGLPASQIAYVDVAREEPTRVIDLAEKPVLALGGLGTFDEFGLHPLSAVSVGSEIWLYYVGWTRMSSVPFNRAIGLATSNDGGKSFRRRFVGPIVSATKDEPYLQQGPSVLRLSPNDWRMWYLTGIAWERDVTGRPEAIYRIAYATSRDGINWTRDGREILPTREESECHAGQALLQMGDSWHMWFSYRRGLNFRNSEGGYRLGYAHSADLVTWSRDDSLVGIDRSAEGWDSEMICYPSIVNVDGRILMFYCGNYFGRDGFGCAELLTG
jgi:hypothetical protein